MKIDDVILWLTLSMLMLFASDVRGQVTTRRGLGAKSRFGIDYVFPLNTMYQRDVFPRTYAQTKVGWVNFARVSWHRIEPTAPVGRVHNYRWEMLDRSVRLWQRHGFRIAMSLRLENGWFAGPIRYRPKMKGLLFELLIQGSDRLPASEHMDAYRAWIRALVERYDGDGKDDMPGLRYPILHYQVGNEYANPVFWSGTLEDYKVLLRETLRAGRSACPHVKIISQGIRWGDLFHDDPEARLFEERFSAFLQRLPSDSWREGWKRAREFTEGTVALARLYDILDAGGNGPHHTASFGYMQWVKRELKKHGLSVAIWDMEARCEPRLVFNPLVHFHRELVIPNGAKVLRLLRAKRHPLHRRAVAWYRAEQARILVKVFVTRFAAGFEKVFMGMASDWTGTLGEFSTANPFIGLLDTQGKPWPAFYALQLLVDKIDGFARAEKMHSPQDVELYRFTFDDGRPEVWVGWLKEMKVRGMGDPLPVKRVRLAGMRGPVVIWTTPTVERMPTSKRWDKTGELIVDLSPTPLIIQKQPR